MEGNLKRMKNDCLVSVLMTSYNREKFIAPAIESVLASIYSDFELIIVDDCSADKTAEIAKRYESMDERIRVYVNRKNEGDYPNRNIAASYAKGKYIKYLDSDDILYPHCLGTMVSSMEKFPSAGFALASLSQVDKPYPVCIDPHRAYMEHFYGYGHFDRAPGSSIIKKAAFDDIGGFKSKRFIGDTEFWFLIAQKFDLVKIQRDLVWDRVHSETEKIYEKSFKGMKRLREDLAVSFLKNPACPLTIDEAKLILKRMKNRGIKHRIKKAVKFMS